MRYKHGLEFLFKHDNVSRLEERFTIPFLIGILATIIFIVTWIGDRPSPENYDPIQKGAASFAFGAFSIATMSTAVLPRMVHNLNKKNPRRIRIPRFQNKLIGPTYTVFVLGLNAFLFILILIKCFAWLDVSLHTSLSENGTLNSIDLIIKLCILLELGLDVGCFILLGGKVKNNPVMFCIIVVESIMTIFLFISGGVEFTGVFQPSIILGLALSVGHLITHWINR